MSFELSSIQEQNMTTRDSNSTQSDMLGLIMKFDTLPEIIVRSYARQLVDALECLHDQRIAHGDLNLESVLLDDNLCLRLSDVRASSGLAEGVCEREHDAFSADIFSLGVTIFELYCGHSPFEKNSLEDPIYSLIAEGVWEEFWAVHEEICSYKGVILHTHIKEFLQSLLHPERPSIKEIKNFTWMKKTCIELLKVESWLVEIAKKRNIELSFPSPVSSA